MENYFGLFTWTLLHVVLCISTSIGQEVVPFDENKVTTMLQHALDCHGTPGMAVAVIKEGQMLYSKGFGFTDMNKETPVTEDTLFGIASISKSFAAALLVKLLDEKTNLELDSKVRELLGEDFVMADDLRTHQTTFLDMLAHKVALLPNNRIRYDTHFNRDTLLGRLRLLPSDKQFRVDYIYSNLVYGLVGRLAEIIDGTGQRWEELVTQHFFQPLGMTKSTFLTRLDYARTDYAKGFMERDGPDEPELITPALSERWAEVCASGAVMSTSKEMTKWMNFHLNLGKNGQGDSVMDAKLIGELHKPRFVTTPLKHLDIELPTFPITAYTQNYALGLRTGYYRGLEYIYHTGTTFGYSAVMAMLPTAKIGVIVLINNSDRYYRQRAAVSHYLLDSALGFEPYINATTVCTYPEPWISNRTLSVSYRPQRSDVPLTFDPKQYQGKYTNEAFGTINIDYNSTLESPVMTYGWGNWELLVWPGPGGNDEGKDGDLGTRQQRLYAKAIGPIFPGDLSPVHFISHPDNERVVVGFKGNALEKRRPPIFCKEDQMDVCADIVKKAYPPGKLKNENYCSNSASSMYSSRTKFGQMKILHQSLNVVIMSLLVKSLNYLS